jgi:triosephosphate isomerase
MARTLMARIALAEPFLLINFKTYLESTGRRAVELAKKIETVGRDTSVNVGVAPQFCDIQGVAMSVDIPVFAQHVDPIGPGAYTGHVLAESVKAAGAEGSIINHSERTLKLQEIEKGIEYARKADLLTVACAGTAKLASAVALAEPDMVAIEPPELIGSGRAVSKERPEVVTESVSRIRSVNASVKILCGAGISTGEDVYSALKLGAQGVLVASAVVKAEKPEEVMMDFCNAVRKYL